MRKYLESSNLTRLTQTLFFINAVIWILFGIFILTRRIGTGEGWLAAAIVVAVLMFGNAAAMLVAGLGIRIRHRWALYFGILVLAINIFLTFTDQVGIWDLVTLMIDLILLGLLVAGRSQLLVKNAA